jgi:hypothetical protein
MCHMGSGEVRSYTHVPAAGILDVGISRTARGDVFDDDEKKKSEII